MRSYLDLRGELLGARLSATNVSLWSQQETLFERARVALNDAIGMRPARVQAVFTSGVLAEGIVVLPRNAERISQVWAVGDTQTAATEVTHYHLFATAQTTYLRVYDAVSGRLEISYEFPQPEFPRPLKVVEDGEGHLICTGEGSPAFVWPVPPAYIEVRYETTSGAYAHYLREVMLYTHATPTSFSGLIRGVEGHQMQWPSGADISLCYVAPNSHIRGLMLMAQAVFYEYLLSNRAMYDQYTAIASDQATPLQEMQVLVRDLEMRARLASRGKSIPRPASGRLRRPIPK